MRISDWSSDVCSSDLKASADAPHVVAIDYGIKRNILRNLVDAGARVTVLPATATFEAIMAHEPDGLFLSYGPGDPAATGVSAVPMIQQWIATRKLPFGICLGQQMLDIAVGAVRKSIRVGTKCVLTF